MEIDPFGFIEDLCHIPKAQESILRKFPFPRKGGIGRDGREGEEKTGYCLNLTESTEIVMASLTETMDEEENEEYHTPRENSPDVFRSDEAAVAGAERVADLEKDDEADASRDVLESGKGGEAGEWIVLKRKQEKIGASRREVSRVSLRSKVRNALGLSDGCLDSEGGNVPDLGSDADSGVLERRFDKSTTPKGKRVLDDCLSEYLEKKLKNAEEKLDDARVVEVDNEIKENLKGGDGSCESKVGYLSRMLKSLEKAVGGDSSAVESDGRLKRTAIDGEIGGTLVRGSRDTAKDVVTGNSEAVDLDGKKSPVKRMKILEVNLQVKTPSSSVGIVKEKIREFLKSMEKLNPQEGIDEGSSMRKKVFENSDCENTTRIDLEVPERNDDMVVVRDVENAASRGEPLASSERRKNLAQTSIAENEKFKCTAKSFHPRDNISMSRQGVSAGHTDVFGKSSEDAQELRKLPASIKSRLTEEGTRKGYQLQAPPLRPDAPSTSDAHRPPKVKALDFLKLMKMIVDARVETNDEIGTESLLYIAKHRGMNLPRPRWWPEGDFKLG